LLDMVAFSLRPDLLHDARASAAPLSFSQRQLTADGAIGAIAVDAAPAMSKNFAAERATSASEGEYEAQSLVDAAQSRCRECAHTLSENPAIERQELGDVDDRGFRQPGL
jgi:hypothetical protein